MRFKRWYFVRFCLSINQRRIKPKTKLNSFNIFMVLIFLDANKSWKYFKKYIIGKAWASLTIDRPTVHLEKT